MRIAVVVLIWIGVAQAGELHDAARECQVERMRHLLSQKPAMNAVDAQGMTPLLVAIEAKQRACVALLVAAGADRKARDGKGRDAFALAVESGDFRIEYAVKNFGRDAKGEAGKVMPWTLESSVMKGQGSLTKMLLEMGADPNSKNAAGISMLAEAALKGDVEAVELLLARGAKVDAVSPSGTQPIHDAALGDSAGVIRALVGKGAEVGARTVGEGQTPLHLAAAMGKVRAAEALVGLGADLGAKDAKGRTALEVAERVGLAEVVAVLTKAK
jgi:ankyrin repeat protein